MKDCNIISIKSKITSHILFFMHFNYLNSSKVDSLETRNVNKQIYVKKYYALITKSLIMVSKSKKRSKLIARDSITLQSNCHGVL